MPGYDDSNALVLPSEKRDAKTKQPNNTPIIKKLNKKERKRLEKIIEQKEKKIKVRMKRNHPAGMFTKLS
jgi:ATP-dependent RNA helicase DHX37/DHR1